MSVTYPEIFWGDRFQQGVLVGRGCDSPLWVQSKAIIASLTREVPAYLQINYHYHTTKKILNLKRLLWAPSLGAQIGIPASKSLWTRLYMCSIKRVL